MVAGIGVVGGLLLGLLAGGRLDNLLAVRLRWIPLLLLGVAVRFGTETAIVGGYAFPDALRVSLLGAGYVLMTLALFANRSFTGMTAAAVGVAANGIAIMANAGRMPVWQPSLSAAGLASDELTSPFHTLMGPVIDAGFLARAGLVGDIIPIPLPYMQSVASIGDLLLAAGLAFVIFGAVVRAQTLVGETGVSVVLPGEGPLGALADHPYARLAVNAPFSALWLGQVVSSLGDRVHQIALVFLVAQATHGSPLAIGCAFAAGMLPNVIVGPVAGAFVDRWDHKRVLVASDLLRAAIVFAIPVAATFNLVLVYPLVFAVSAASTFFRPARSAVLPQIVTEDELMTANSAMWTADTAADVVGYPLAGLFVAFLGSSLSMAFWVDGVSYMGSAALIAAVAIPRISSRRIRKTSVVQEIAQGWCYLRDEAALFGTTIQAVVAEFGVGALTVLSPLLIASLPVLLVPAPTGYGYFETAIGVGALLGGLAVGALGERVSGGRAIVAGFVTFGIVLILLALSSALPLTLVLGFAAGIANVVFVVPSQTLFQQRTPPELLGRVIAIRLAVVNGGLAIAMVASGSLAELAGVPMVLGACGVLTVVAGGAGLLVKAIREA